MIGNLTFEAPDAFAAAMEIARRGIAARAKIKDLLLVFDEWLRDGLRKDLALSAEAEGWVEIHRAIKAAKLGVRRPHPRLPEAASQVALRCDGLAGAGEVGSSPSPSAPVSRSATLRQNVS